MSLKKILFSMFMLMLMLAWGLAMQCQCVCSAEIYSYVDSKGTWHFTNVPSSSLFRKHRVTLTGNRAHKKRKKSTKKKRLSHREIAHIVSKKARAYNLDPDLIKAVIKVESDGIVNAQSPKGAIGLMQLMPETARELGVGDPYNPVENIDGGAKYLRKMLERFDGDVLLALAAYNAGPDTVQRYNGLPPYRETVKYVEKVLLEWFNNKKRQ